MGHSVYTDSCDLSPTCNYPCAVSVSSPAEERLLSKLMQSPHFSPRSIPVLDVGESVHVTIALTLMKVIQVVRNYDALWHLK